MKHRDSMARWFTPGVIADIPTGRLVWVDAVHGNNDLAVRERMTVPFKTLAKAKEKAVSGDTIVVMPGVYNERDLAKTGVNWHFMSGAVVRYTDVVGPIFDTNGLGGAVFKVSGYGQFETTDTTSPQGCLLSVNSLDDVQFEFDSIKTKGICFRNTAGSKLRVRGKTIRSDNDMAVVVEGSGIIHMDVREISSQDDPALLIDANGCDVSIEAFYITTLGSANAVDFKQSYFTFIKAAQIRSAAGRGVLYDSSGSDPLHLDVARIISALNGSSGQAIYIDQGSEGLYLYGCKLIVNTAASGLKSIDADAATGVVAMSPVFANAAKGSNVLFHASSFAVSSNVR